MYRLRRCLTAPTTRPDWELRPAVRVSYRRDGEVDRGVRGLRRGRPGSGTWSGLSSDKRPHPAEWRRLRLGRDRQSAARAAGRALSVVLRASARGAGEIWKVTDP